MDKNKKMTFKFDKSGVWKYFRTFQTAGIPGVGQVTVRYSTYQQIVFSIRCLNAEDKALRLRAATHVNVALEFLQNNILALNHDGDWDLDFKNPLKMAIEELPIIGISEEAIRTTMIVARRMFFVPNITVKDLMVGTENMSEDLKRTIDNLLEFSMFMEKVGRMAQEGVIDAAKVGVYPELPLFEEMAAVSMVSRKETANLRLDFKQGRVNITYPKTKQSKTKKTIAPDGGVKKFFVYADFFDFIRNNAFKELVSDDAKLKVFEKKQELAIEIAEEAVKIAKSNPGKVKTVRIAMEMFHSINDAKKAIVTDDLEKEHKDVLEEQQTVLFGALTNTVRMALSGLSAKEKALLSIGVSLLYKKKESDIVSAFTSTVLPEEFFEVLADYAGIEESVTEVMVEGRIEDETELSFVDGVAEGDILVVEANPSSVIDGKYTIRKEGKKYYAVRKVVDILEERIANNYDSSSIMLCTLPESGHSAAKTIEMVKNAGQVVLPRKVNGRPKAMYNVLFADNEFVGKYKTKIQAYKEGSEGKLVPNYDEGMTICDELSNLYAMKAGKFAYCGKGAYTDKKGIKEVVFIVLKDVRDVKASELNKNAMEASYTRFCQTEAVAQQQAKTDKGAAQLNYLQRMAARA